MSARKTSIPQPYRDMGQALEDVGIRFAAALPDDWVAPLISDLESRPAVKLVRVAREPEISGLCSGAFFGGVKSVGILGATGFLTTVCELATLNIKQQIPLFLIVSDRGTFQDYQSFQEIQGRVGRKICQSLDMPFETIYSNTDLENIPRYFNSSRLHKRPFVLWINQKFVSAH